MKKIIKADYYWNVLLKEALKITGYLPENLYELITTSKQLKKYITPEIIKDWYEDNIDYAFDEIIYDRNISTKYFSQSRNTRDLEDCIKEVFQIKYIEYIEDTTACIYYEE